MVCLAPTTLPPDPTSKNGEQNGYNTHNRRLIQVIGNVSDTLTLRIRLHRLWTGSLLCNVSPIYRRYIALHIHTGRVLCVSGAVMQVGELYTYAHTGTDGIEGLGIILLVSTTLIPEMEHNDTDVYEVVVLILKLNSVISAYFTHTEWANTFTPVTHT